MATGNGHDPNTTRMVELLEQIVAEAKATNARLDRVEGRLEVGLSELRGELVTFRKDVDRALTEIHHEIADTNVRVSETNERLVELKEEVHELKGEVHELRQDLKGPLERRVAKLEAAVFRPTGTG